MHNAARPSIGEKSTQIEREQKQMAEKTAFEEEGASFEEIFGRLEGIVEQIEQGELPLEEWMKLFEEGLHLCKAGKVRLDAANRTIEQLVRDAQTGKESVVPYKGDDLF